MALMMPNSKRGKELREMLEEALGIPSKSRWFEVRFAVDELVTVKCEFMPEEPDDAEHLDKT